MIGIYKITNLINGKVYIGQSININKRFVKHRNVAFNTKSVEYNYPLYCAIRKYGLNNFSFEVLEECLKNELNTKEIYYIKQHNSNNPKYGYNQSNGGQDNSIHCKLSENDIDEILNRLKTTLDTTKTIAKDFGVSYSTIRDINVGKAYRRHNEAYPIRPALNTLCITTNGYETKSTEFHCVICGAIVSGKGNMCKCCTNMHNSKIKNKPDPLSLAKLITENGFEKTGKMFGVSGKAIVKWCEKYNIPNKKKDLIAWYNNQIGIHDITKIKKNKEMNKPVAQLDTLNGNIIALFKNANYAAKTIGKKTGQHIREVCNGQRESAYGYKWCFVSREYYIKSIQAH